MTGPFDFKERVVLDFSENKPSISIRKQAMGGDRHREMTGQLEQRPWQGGQE